MSQITEIILTIAKCENGRDGRVVAVDAINAWLTRGNKGKLKRVDGYAGGHKEMQSIVLMGAFNYLLMSEFVEVVRTAPWVNIDGVSLFAKLESVHERFIEIQIPRNDV